MPTSQASLPPGQFLQMSPMARQASDYASAEFSLDGGEVDVNLDHDFPSMQQAGMHGMPYIMDTPMQMSPGEAAGIGFNYHPSDYRDPPKEKKPRRSFTKEEDDALWKGYQEHGTQWSIIAKDPALCNRKGTDLRDRFRNRFPDLYAAAGYKPRLPRRGKRLSDKALDSAIPTQDDEEPASFPPEEPDQGETPVGAPEDARTPQAPSEGLNERTPTRAKKGKKEKKEKKTRVTRSRKMSDGPKFHHDDEDFSPRMSSRPSQFVYSPSSRAPSTVGFTPAPTVDDINRTPVQVYSHHRRNSSGSLHRSGSDSSGSRFGSSGGHSYMSHMSPRDYLSRGNSNTSLSPSSSNLEHIRNLQLTTPNQDQDAEGVPDTDLMPYQPLVDADAVSMSGSKRKSPGPAPRVPTPVVVSSAQHPPSRASGLARTRPQNPPGLVQPQPVNQIRFRRPQSPPSQQLPTLGPLAQPSTPAGMAKSEDDDSGDLGMATRANKARKLNSRGSDDGRIPSQTLSQSWDGVVDYNAYPRRERRRTLERRRTFGARSASSSPRTSKYNPMAMTSNDIFAFHPPPVVPPRRPLQYQFDPLSIPPPSLQFGQQQPVQAVHLGASTNTSPVGISNPYGLPFQQQEIPADQDPSLYAQSSTSVMQHPTIDQGVYTDTALLDGSFSFDEGYFPPPVPQNQQDPIIPVNDAYILSGQPFDGQMLSMGDEFSQLQIPNLPVESSMPTQQLYEPPPGPPPDWGQLPSDAGVQGQPAPPFDFPGAPVAVPNENNRTIQGTQTFEEGLLSANYPGMIGSYYSTSSSSRPVSTYSQSVQDVDRSHDTTYLQRLGLDTSIYFPQDVSAPQETPPVYPTIDVSTAYTPQIGSQGGSIFAGQFSQVETETGEARFTINENFTTINPAANVVEVGPSPFKAGASSHLTLVEASSPFNPIVSSSPPGLQGNTSNA
ncbi:hypothetical protein BT69DRAFT_1297339 [Atractiella rhizophila]|nr:hypothetical protein BT69DRAFT_1297339 [Atractiella rhizophila]